jgi:hypothetical protein
MNDEPTPDDDVDRTDDITALKAEAKQRRLTQRPTEAERDHLQERLDARSGARILSVAAADTHRV